MVKYRQVEQNKANRLSIRPIWELHEDPPMYTKIHPWIDGLRHKKIVNLKVRMITIQFEPWKLNWNYFFYSGSKFKIGDMVQFQLIEIESESKLNLYKLISSLFF